MAYTKYYSDGWKNNEDGNTPITAAALNHMENGIVTANAAATTTTAGLMSAQDKSKLNGITAGAAVTGVKGNAESSYRSGNVNLTPANIGALPSNTTYVSGVKGNSESSYRSGNVNLTPANLGAVAKSGDTMTGVLKRSSNINYNTTPSSTVTNDVIQALDSDGYARARVYQAVGDTRNKFLYIMAKDVDGSGNQTNYNQIGIGLSSSGSPIFSIGSSQGSAPTAFRSALGLGTSGAFPITVAQGGTGLTSNPSMLVNLGTTSAASIFASSPRPGVTGTLKVGNGGTGLTASPSMIVDLSSTSAANILVASPSPGITGTLPVNHGGTGRTSAPSMLTDLGSTTAANILTASPRPGITGTLAVGHGGTGATTAAAARTNLGAQAALTVEDLSSSIVVDLNSNYYSAVTKRCYRYGKVVVFNFRITVTRSINLNTNLFSGFPAPVGVVYGFGALSDTGLITDYDSVIFNTNSGHIVQFQGYRTPENGDYLYGSFTYICQ